MIIFMQNIILTLQCYVKESENFVLFFIKNIIVKALILNHYKLILLLCIIIKHVNNLII